MIINDMVSGRLAPMLVLAHPCGASAKPQRLTVHPALLAVGKGTVIYKNGDKYEGDWENGMRSGLGTLWLFRDGKYVVRYNGQWANDKPSVSQSIPFSVHSLPPPPSPHPPHSPTPLLPHPPPPVRGGTKDCGCAVAGPA